MYSDINHLFIIFCFILVNQNLLHGGGGLGYISGGGGISTAERVLIRSIYRNESGECC